MPYDFTIHEKTLRRDGLRKSDFDEYRGKIPQGTLENILQAAETTGRTGFTALLLAKSKIHGKNAYKLREFADELVLRIISKNLVRLTGSRQSNRLSISRSLNNLFQEGYGYRVYKLDIRSFYESVNVENILKNLSRDSSFSKSSLHILNTFFDRLTEQNIPGLPRGISISATLSEYALKYFDKEISNNKNVFYYSRFVDDIIIITSGAEKKVDFLELCKRTLPSGLLLNQNKTKVYDLFESPLNKNAVAHVQAEIVFLGYQFRIFGKKRSDYGIGRAVDVDISSGKAKKIKSKISHAFISYNKNLDFDLLYERMKLLSGNYVIFDHARGVRRKAGIFFNYQLTDGEKSSSLREIDKFYRQMILANTGKICSRLAINLSSSQKRTLLKLSFSEGFNKRIFYHFPAQRLVRVMECWKYA